MADSMFSGVTLGTTSRHLAVKYPDWRQMRGGPAGQLELRVAGAVTGGHPVVVLRQHRALPVHQHGTERLVPGRERLGGQFHAAAQVGQFVVLHHG